MNRFLLLSLACLFAVAILPNMASAQGGLADNSEHPAFGEPASTDEFLSTLAAAPKRALLNPATPHYLTARNGTQIGIPADAFVLENGEPAPGPVVFEYQDFLRPVDMITAGMPTSSASQALRTGGSVSMKANYQGQAVRLAPGKEIELRFPGQAERRMELFEGKTKNGVFQEWVRTKRPARAPVLLEQQTTTECLVCGPGSSVAKDYLSIMLTQRLLIHYKLTLPDNLELGIEIDQKGKIIRTWLPNSDDQVLEQAISEILANLTFFFNTGDITTVTIPLRYLNFFPGEEDKHYFRQICSFRINSVEITEEGSVRKRSKKNASLVFAVDQLGMYNADIFLKVKITGKRKINITDTREGADLTGFVVLDQGRQVIPARSIDGDGVLFEGNWEESDQVTFVILRYRKYAGPAFWVYKGRANSSPLQVDLKEGSREEVIQMLESL